MGVEYDLVIKQGDTKPVLTATILDQSGNVVNLTSCTVTFVMRALTAITPAVQQTATIVSPTAGTVSFQFSAAQTAIAGTYMATFLVTFADTSTMSFPVDGYLEVSVEENLLTPGGATVVSLAEVKDHLNIPAADRTQDAKLIRMIAGATPVVELITGPLLLKQVEEWHSGGQVFIELREPPVEFLESVTIFVGLTPYQMAIIEDPAHGTIYSVMKEPGSAMVTRRTTGGAVTPFPSGPESVHVWYQAGRLTIPKNITEGMLELLRIHFTKTQRGRPAVGAGADGLDTDDPGREILGFYVPNSVRERLEPSRRPIGIY